MAFNCHTLEDDDHFAAMAAVEVGLTRAWADLTLDAYFAACDQPPTAAFPFLLYAAHVHSPMLLLLLLCFLDQCDTRGTGAGALLSAADHETAESCCYDRCD